jgi:signal transduction histidine kinase
MNTHLATTNAATRRARRISSSIARQQLLALAARFETALETERAAIAREIHDTLGQSLTALKIDLHALIKESSKSNDAQQIRADLRARAQTMLALLDEAIHNVQNISAKLRPAVLDDLGLLAAIEWQACEFQNRTGAAVDFTRPAAGLKLNDDQAIALFRILQEALTNIARHANASKVKIRLRNEGERDVVLTIKDNGRGITSEETASRRSLGLLGIRERAAALGGTATICGEKGKGTTITVKIPC